MNWRTWAVLTAIFGASSMLWGQATMFEKPLDLNGDNGPFSELGGQQVADEFVVNEGGPFLETGTVQRYRLWGSYFLQGDPFDDGDVLDFQVRFYANDSGFPASTAFFTADLQMVVTDTGLDQLGDRIYMFEAVGAGPYLVLDENPKVRYFEALENDPDTALSQFRWANAASDGTNSYFRSSDGGTWELDGGNRGNHAFFLGTVPEPGSLAALMLGGFALARRLKTRPR